LSTSDSAETINSDSTGLPNTAQPAESEPQITAASAAQPVNSEAQLTAAAAQPADSEPQITAASAAQPVNSEAQLTAAAAMNAPAARPQTDSALRRSRWKSSLDAYKRLAKLSTMPRRQFRDSDRVTATLLTISVVLLCVMLVIPLPVAIPFVALGDVLLFITLIFFLANRFGIITHLSDRDAVLVSDLMTGMLLLGLLFASNIGFFLIVFMTFFR